MVDRVVCTVDGCGNAILPETAQETGGPCMACVGKKKAAERRAHIEANRVDIDRFAGVTDPVEILALMSQRPKFDPLVRHVSYPESAYDVYVRLSPDQIAAVRDRVIRLLETDAEQAAEIAGELTTFTTGEFGPLHEAFFQRDSLWPPYIFRGAAASVRDRLIRALDGPDLRRNHALLALAWIGDPVVVSQFNAWRRTPPQWAAELHVEPHDYAKAAGWELSSDGARRELTVQPCFALVPDRADSSEVVVVTDRGDRCPWCEQPLIDLLAIDMAVSEFSSWGMRHPRVTITTCHVCSGYGTVFCDSTTEGSARWSKHNVKPDYLPDDAANWGRMPTRYLGAAAQSRPPHTAIDWMTDVTLSQVGGLPSWIQDEAHPKCPGCNSTMMFVGQVSNEELAEFSEGVYYAFFCRECGIGATEYQQT